MINKGWHQERHNIEKKTCLPAKPIIWYYGDSIDRRHLTTIGSLNKLLKRRKMRMKIFRLSLSFPYTCVQELEHQEFENMVVTIECEFPTTSSNNIIASACTCLKVQKKGKIMWAQQSLHVGPEAHDLLILGPQYHKRYTYPYVVVQ